MPVECSLSTNKKNVLSIFIICNEKYKHIIYLFQSGCAALRRQKELELQVVTGEVRGWPGGDITALGDVLHMGSVAVGPSHQDRYLVLFPSALLLLSVSKRVSAFVYEVLA